MRFVSILFFTSLKLKYPEKIVNDGGYEMIIYYNNNYYEIMMMMMIMIMWVKLKRVGKGRGDKGKNFKNKYIIK